ncbi:hypothetical protein BDR06DRAFT_970029 [Suillus hirtellus]|nr:hypothetical protein BDR06DRAFT_970029 [Suillus hirtellus]
MSHTEGSLSHIKDRQYHDNNLWQPSSEPSQAQLASVQAWQRQRIAELENQLVTLELGHAVKESENDRRYDAEDEETSLEQDRLQAGYITLMNTLPWFYRKSSEIDYDDYMHMLKMLRQGADSAQGDNTSKLKALVSEWVNCKLKPDPLVDMDDKHTQGFVNDGCGKLLCPAELDWNNPTLLVQKIHHQFGQFGGRSLQRQNLASAKDVEGDGDGADVIENNRHARKASSGIKVKKHVAQIIKMEKVSDSTWSVHQLKMTAGRPLWTFLKGPPVETRSTESTDSLNGGLEKSSEGVAMMTLLMMHGPTYR